MRLFALLFSLFALAALSQPVQAGRIVPLVDPEPVVEKGTPYIHRNDLSWIDTIMRDVRTNVQLTRAE